MNLTLDDFDYILPTEQIAQSPAERREGSRLMVLNRETRTIEHATFADLPAYLHPGDMLVANRSRVIPARLFATRETGGRVELLLLQALSPNRWIALARPSRKLRPGTKVSVIRSDLEATLEERREEGQWVVRFTGEGDVAEQLRAAGSLPLPPYIRSEGVPPHRYQTVYADRDGSIAAPTAGLHFSDNLLARLEADGIAMRYVTLHVGLGTFKPVTAVNVQDHHMHAEWGEIPAEVAADINHLRRRGGRVIAVGTTTTRLLESAVKDGTVHPFRGETDRFIYPGYTFGAIDGLVTNFHLPRSTLLMLVSAFADRDFVLGAYSRAVENGYRFYSFGDAMLIL